MRLDLMETQYLERARPRIAARNVHTAFGQERPQKKALSFRTQRRQRIDPSRTAAGVIARQECCDTQHRDDRNVGQAYLPARNVRISRTTSSSLWMKQSCLVFGISITLGWGTPSRNFAICGR